MTSDFLKISQRSSHLSPEIGWPGLACWIRLANRLGLSTLNSPFSWSSHLQHRLIRNIENSFPSASCPLSSPLLLLPLIRPTPSPAPAHLTTGSAVLASSFLIKAATAVPGPAWELPPEGSGYQKLSQLVITTGSDCLEQGAGFFLRKAFIGKCTFLVANVNVLNA